MIDSWREKRQLCLAARMDSRCMSILKTTDAMLTDAEYGVQNFTIQVPHGRSMDVVRGILMMSKAPIEAMSF